MCKSDRISHAHHVYRGDTLQMQHSSLDFQLDSASPAQRVWDVFYPGFQTLDEAFHGVDLNRTKELVRDAQLPADLQAQLERRLDANPGLGMSSGQPPHTTRLLYGKLADVCENRNNWRYDAAIRGGRYGERLVIGWITAVRTIRVKKLFSVTTGPTAA